MLNMRVFRYFVKIKESFKFYFVNKCWKKCGK